MSAPGTAVGLLLFATLVACSGGADSSPTAPPPPPRSLPRDTLAIVAVEPAAGTTLTEGVSVLVEARLAYHLERAATGRISVLVVCIEDGNMVCLSAGGLAEVPSADGEVVVHVGLKPLGSLVQVRFSVVPDGWSVTTAQAEVFYRIG